ncbi:MAG: AI-2E family transporter [Ruminococcus sp.]|nr:AI-2E family transporter [Ruminococcus sp.]MCM1478435.1 AI-2E family transporter [Muribaculaceae bacterium]
MDKKTAKTIITAVFLAAGAVAAVLKPEFFTGVISRIFKLFMPVFLGLAIAFVMNMPVCRFQKLFSGRFRDCPRCVTVAAVGVAYLLLVALIAGIFWIIIPQLAASVKLFIGNADYYYSNFVRYCDALEKRDALGIFSSLKAAVTGLGERLPAILGTTYAKTSDIIGGAADLLIGFVISIYILLDKENIRKAVSAVAKRLAGERYEKLKNGYRLVFSTFSRFVSGQITEAVILGVLCFIGMKLFRFEYALLISTIIGVTALVPVVGAIIGTVPSAFLLLLINPVKALWFVVFIIILQQLENNFIYPRVVGKSLGIPPLLVLLAILLGAGIGGAAGMLLGVPIMSVAYAVLREKILQAETADKIQKTVNSP